MTPASPDDLGAATTVAPVRLRPPGFDQLPPDVRAQLELVLAPVEATMTELDQLRADVAVHLEAERHQGMDPQMEAALNQAARNPDAPQSLKKVAHRVSLGQMSWSDVFGPGAGASDDPTVADARRDVFTAARELFDEGRFKVEIVPDPEAPATGTGTNGR